MPADDWQRALRRQFGREQGFALKSLADVENGARPSPVFSDFLVSNADSGGRYRVAIRGTANGDNLCTCPDFATNDLGTCKHIEFTLAKLAARRGGKAALARGFVPPYSEVFLHHDGQRTGAFAPVRIAHRRCCSRRGACSMPRPGGRWLRPDWANSMPSSPVPARPRTNCA